MALVSMNDSMLAESEAERLLEIMKIINHQGIAIILQSPIGSMRLWRGRQPDQSCRERTVEHA